MNLLGEPPQLAECSQWWSPMWFAMLAAAWVPRGGRVVEPSCGSGNLIEALLRLGHRAEDIVAVEKDPAWADFTRARFEGRVQVICGNFLSAEVRAQIGSCDSALTNPPFEDGLHEQFVTLLIEMLIPCVVGILPHSIEYGLDRDRDLWPLAYVARRARLPGRVKYGGDHSASFETVCLQIKRRTAPRVLTEILYVAEEVWRSPP